jgi:photosystem II stability/assembly factor-like uncharacterized protein
VKLMIAAVLFVLSQGPARAAEWSWTVDGLQTRWGVLALAVNPSDPRLQYAGDDEGGLYRTADGGASWQTLWEPRPNDSYPFAIRTITVAPNDPAVLYVPSGGAVHRSTDAGQTWAPIQSLQGGPVVAAAQPGVIYNGSTHGVFRSTDDGASWEYLALEALGGGTVRGLSVSPHDPARLFATVAQWAFAGDSQQDWINHVRLLASADAGSSWEDLSDNVSADLQLLCVAVSPADADVVYAGGYDWAGGERHAVLLKSDDAGRSWARVFELEHSQFSTVAADPVDADVVYAGSMGKVTHPGLFTSRDGGATWTRIHEGGPGAIVIDPIDRDRLHVAMRERVQGVYHFARSADPGEGTALRPTSWARVKATSVDAP